MTVGLPIRTLVPVFSSSFFNDTLDGLDDLYGVERYDHTVTTGGSPMDVLTVSLKRPRFPSTVLMYISSSSASILFIRMLLQIDTRFFCKDTCFGLTERNTEGWRGFHYSNTSLMSVRPTPPWNGAISSK